MKQQLKTLACSSTLLLALAAGGMTSAFAAEGQAGIAANLVVKDSYIVTFHESADPARATIWPVDLAKKTLFNFKPTPFGEHGTGQSKEGLAKELGISGKVGRIFPTINAAHIYMTEKEAERMRQDKRVKLVEPSLQASFSTTQTSPGWALDRLDQPKTTLPDGRYNYTNTGANRTIYILDSGLTLRNPQVAAEFEGRATNFYDFTPGGDGADCIGHGSAVASVAAGRTKGIAKGATLKIVKISNGCEQGPRIENAIASFDWLAANAPRGTIVNYSVGLSAGPNNCPVGGIISTALEASIQRAFASGIIVVVAAGNDNCNTANYSPTRIPEAFVVGATNNNGLNLGIDPKWSLSRTGTNISTFAPGFNVPVMTMDGGSGVNSGTSFSAPYIAGIFAVACQAAGTLCETSQSTQTLYDALRNTGTLGTVTNTNGTPLTGATSRFITQQW